MNETALIGCIARIARAGETIDTVTVGKNAMPDVDPVTNWTSLDCIMNAKQEVEKKNFGTKVCMDEEGNVSERPIDKIVRDSIVFTSQEMSPLVTQLQYGLTGAPVEGGAEVEMNEDTTREIYAWLWVKGVRIGGGGEAVDFKVWGYFTLEQAYEFDTSKIGELALRFTMERGSSLGSPISFSAAS